MTPQELFDKNIPLVHHTIKKYFSFVFGKSYYEDVVQEGNIGLYMACLNYNPALSKFSTYAVRSIWGAIMTYLHEETTLIKIPRKIQDALSIESRVSEDKFNEFLQNESISLEDVQKARDIRNIKDEMLLNSEGDVVSVFDLIPDNSFKEESMNFEFNDFMWKHLPLIYHTVIALKYIGFTQLEISHKLGLSQAQVSRRLKFAKEMYNRYTAGSFLNNILLQKYDFLCYNISIFDDILSKVPSSFNKSFKEFYMTKRDSIFQALDKGVSDKEIMTTFNITNAGLSHYKWLKKSSPTSLESTTSSKLSDNDYKFSDQEAPMMVFTIDEISVERKGNDFRFSLKGQEFIASMEDLDKILFMYQALKGA